MMEPDQGAPDRSTSLWTGVLVFAGFLVFTPPIPYWLDAPEFIAASWNLGHAHPPGHPVILMLLKAFLLIPIGEASFRANLFSAGCGALSAGLVCRIALALTSEMAPKRTRARQFAGLAAGLGFGWSLSSTIQSLSVEVYTLNLALVLAALALALRKASDWRVVGPIAILLGLALGNHHYLTLLAVPALAVAVLRQRGRDIQPVLAAGLVIVVAIVFLYGYLYARGLVGSWPGWADTSHLNGVFWVASARLFAESLGGFEDPIAGIAGNLVKAIALLASDFSPVGVVLAVGGVYLGVRLRRLSVVIVLLLLVAGSLASKVLMGILDPNNPDDHGYFLGAVAGVAVFQGAFGAGLLAAVGHGAPMMVRWAVRSLGVASLIATALTPAALSLPTARERLFLRDPVSITRLIWDEQPSRSVLFLSHYPVFFQAMYARVVEGARPDVTLVQSSLYRKAQGGRFYAERLEREDPDLGALLRRFMQHGTLDASEIRRLAENRPVRFDAEDEPIMTTLRCAGWTMEVLPRSTALSPEGRSPCSADAARDHVARLRSLVPTWPEPMDIETRRVLIRHLASMARTLAGLRQWDAASVLVDSALELNPIDRTLRSLAAQFRAGS